MGSPQGPIFRGPEFDKREIRPHRNWLEKVGGFIAARTAQEKGALITVFGSFSLALLLSLTQCSHVSTENAVLKHDTQNMAAKIREQDTTILTLATEKASLANQAAVAASIPLHVPSIISNLDNILATEPTNRQQLLSLLYSVEALTNALAEATARPTFDLFINDIKITNDTVLDLNKSRILYIRVVNTSLVSIEQLTVRFYAAIDMQPTNLIADGWALGPQMSQVIDGHWPDTPMANVWIWRADSLVSPNAPNYNGAYNVNSLKISTNYHSPVLEAGILVYAARSMGVNHKVTLRF
jgi:hypothetical protein